MKLYIRHGKLFGNIDEMSTSIYGTQNRHELLSNVDAYGILKPSSIRRQALLDNDPLKPFIKLNTPFIFKR